MPVIAVGAAAPAMAARPPDCVPVFTALTSPTSSLCIQWVVPDTGNYTIGKTTALARHRRLSKGRNLRRR